jgi:hypothetical protein
MKSKMKPDRRSSCLRFLVIAVAAVSSLCLVLAGISFLFNRAAPDETEVLDHLTEADKANLAEVFHLQDSFGDQVLPGWAQADIAVILYNENYAFLVGYPHPPDGWIKLPQGTRRGGAWEAVADDDFQGQVYYRQPLPDPDITPQAFTVQVGERWAASMNTRAAMKRTMARIWEDELPGFLKPIFPYRLVVDIFLGGSDQYAAVIMHEATHAYQGIRAAEKLKAAEQANIQYAEYYPVHDQAFRSDWEQELNDLQQGLKAKSDQDVREAARQFLAHRQQRRQAAGLSDQLTTYERQREWVEGMARYAEVEVYRLAGLPGYTPSAAIQENPQFHSYKSFQRRWQNEVMLFDNLAGKDGDSRFYSTGMAQAVMLDRLMPGWKERIFADGVWLEDLLSDAVK